MTCGPLFVRITADVVRGLVVREIELEVGEVADDDSLSSLAFTASWSEQVKM